IELNRLNESGEEINRLENDLDKARSDYQNILSNRTHELDQLSSHIRKSISLSRAYYEKKDISKCVQEETLRAARHFQTANSIYQAAKETILLAEEKLLQENSDECHTSELSSSTQEALNHAIIRLMEAEREKRKREEEHHRTASICSELEVSIKKYERLYTKAIAKSRPYFEKKNEMKEALQLQKKKVDCLQANLQEMKAVYSEALRNLERISEEVHKRRKLKEFLYLPREPGVGSEHNERHNSIEFETEAKLRSCSLSTTTNDDKDTDTNNNEEKIDNNRSSNNENYNNNNNSTSRNWIGVDSLSVESVVADYDDGSSSSEMSFGEDTSTDQALSTSTDEESTDEMTVSPTLLKKAAPTSATIDVTPSA
ncbi:SH3 domain-binding protein 5 homolog, partial [Octopus sinensis]|uniref:SH3 domain-binding protein 5 homolog n=1 Tax=Octopus sinensis TaxID=2607531 RepID=A0A6P7TPY3_9MOLL